MPYKDPEERRRHLAEKREADPEWHEKRKQSQRDWYAANRESELARQKAKRDAMTPEERSAYFRPKTKERLAARAAYQNKYYHSHPELRNKYSKVRNRKLRTEREKIAGRPYPKNCEIPACSRKGRTHWDHCRASNRFRGYPCPNCNKILGLAGDSSAILRDLADYLDRGGYGPGPSWY